MQGVVHVSPDGRSARGRWRTLIMGGMHGQDGTWTEGPFENEYVKENGVWKFQQGPLVHDGEGLVRQGLAQEAHPGAWPARGLAA